MQHAILIIPAYNEAATLERVLAGVANADLDCEVVVIDDGSRDETAAIASRMGATLLRHPFNLGYGAALQTGYKYALERRASLLLQMDADGQHDPSEIVELAKPVSNGTYDLVVGSRFLDAGGYHMGFLRRVGRELFRVIARVAGLRVSDPTSGFQCMNGRVLEVYARDFFPTDYPDVDVLLTAYRSGLRVGEQPVHMLPGSRRSTMHGGLRSFYYVYKMLLATWSASSHVAKVPTGGGPEPSPREEQE
jgi:glycosyltransferase involved in cell wall biosynthesis